MSEKNIPVEEIQQLAEIIKDQGLTEIEFESESIGRIKVKKEANPVTVSAVAPNQAAPIAVAPALTPQSAAPIVSEAPTANSNLIEITSPMVGTFYAASSPEAEPFVKVGSSFNNGDVLCILEAMKIMNELPADISGTIAEICVQDGQSVSYGEVLFRISK